MDPVISWPSPPREQHSDEKPPRRKTSPSSSRKRRLTAAPAVEVPSLIRSALGPLECEVLRQMCGFGESTAREVLHRIPRPLAYTTVMTTMARLYRKGLLGCRMSGKTFVYRSRLSSAQLEMQLAHDLVRALVSCDGIQNQDLAAAMVEAMRRERPQLLQELKQALHQDDS